MTKYSMFTFEIELELLAWLEKEAKRLGCTKDEIVEQAIRKYMEACDQDREISNASKS